MRNSAEHNGMDRSHRNKLAKPSRADLRVQSLSRASTQGRIILGPLSFPCALGRSGRQVRKREGDGVTPSGVFRLRRVFYRPDRINRPRTLLPVTALKSSDGWCDAMGDRNYNRRVTHPYPASAEAMWRDDDLYNVVIVLDYNERPRVQGRGSAIFVHIARSSYSGTAGCIALKANHLSRLLARVGPKTRLRIGR